MAVYDLEEQEQIDELKAWWKQYGSMVTNVLLAVSLVVAGWQGWNWYQRSQSGQAAVAFAALQQAVEANDAQKVKLISGELTAKFGSTTQAHLGALLAAKVSFDAEDLKTARAQLSWVADNARDELKDVARLNLVAVLLDDKAYDEALKQLDGSHAPGFAARFAEARGDVLLAQGKKSEAKVAYQAAVKALEAGVEKSKDEKSNKLQRPQGPGLEILQQKLDALHGVA